MTHANEPADNDRVISAGSADRTQRPDLVTRLDHTINRMRRLVTRPPSEAVPITRLGHRVDLAKIMACEAIDDLSQAHAELGSGPVTISDVAAALQLDRSTVSRLVGECESEGLIRRTKLATDARRVGLELTDDGRIAMEESAEQRCRFLGYATESFTPEDLKIFVSLMERFTDEVTAGLPTWLAGNTEGLTPSDSSAPTAT